MNCLKKFASTLLMGLIFPACALAGNCTPQIAGVVIATPLSSRIDRVGDPVQAVLEQALSLGETAVLPSGTLLNGRVIALRSPSHGQSGQIQFQFTHASGSAMDTQQTIDAMPATTDGWLRQSDVMGPVWQISPTRSTRLLNEIIQRRLGSNRAVWAQILGINENTIPDVTTDEFMHLYNRQDVLVGAGDRIQVLFTCGQPLNTKSSSK